MNWKIHDYDKVMKAMRDPKKILRRLTMTLENDKPHGPMTDEGFDISRDLIQAAFSKMRKTNADKLEMSFKECGKLMGYNLVITMTSPDYKEPWLVRMAKKISL